MKINIKRAFTQKPNRRIIGLHACKETLKIRPWSISIAYLSHQWKKSVALKELHALLLNHKIPITYKRENFLKNWQGLALDCHSRPTWDWSIVKKSKQIVLVAIDSLEDPQNLGNILRSSWLFGVYGIILGKHHCVHLTPAVHKVASGGVEHVPIQIVSNLLNELQKLKDLGFWIYGLETYREKNSKPLWQETFPKKIILIVGAESKGLRKGIKGVCDQILTIPQVEKTHSLNASTSLAVALYDVHRNFSLK